MTLMGYYKALFFFLGFDETIGLTLCEVDVLATFVMCLGIPLMVWLWLFFGLTEA
jgi:hypothetical protein